MLERVRSCFRGKERDRTHERRSIGLGDPQARRQFPSNEVRSSKYNVATFIPMNLWEQFHRPINLYFLLVATLQFIPGIAPVSPYTVIFPITVAFSINTVKEGIDDVRRHRQDRESNSRRHTIVDPVTRQWKEVRSEDIHVGDVLLLRPFEIAPSDVVVLMASGEDGEAYVSTESLDGETGTKERLAVLRDYYDAALMASSQPILIGPGAAAPAAATAAAETRTTNTRSSQVHIHPPPAPHELREAIAFLDAANIVVNSEGPNPFLHSYNATLTLTTPPTADVGVVGGGGNNSDHHRHGDRAANRSTERQRHSATLQRSGNSTSSLGSGDEREALLGPSPADNHSGTESRDESSPQRVHGERKSLGVTIDNVILASSMTRNSRFVVAMAVFTGMETKVAMTRGAPPSKWANIDHRFNYMTTAIFLLQLVLLVLCSYLSISSLHDHPFWYLGGHHRRIPFTEYVPVLPLRFFTMLSPMVPLSFKVMVEISKGYISSIIRWDDDLADTGKDGTGEHASVNNSALAEDLGQIEYILSDKTGTLTANIMTLTALATADGTVYMCDPDEASRLACRRATDIGELPESVVAKESATGMWALLAGMTFCNSIERSLLGGTVRPPQSTLGARKRRKKRPASAPAPEKVWASCSPDEVALVEGVELCGVTLLERTRKMSRARFWDSPERVDILKVLPFTSERGRMGVLLKRVPEEDGLSPVGSVGPRPPGREDGDGGYLLLMKGSDEKLLPLCDEASYLSPSVPKESQPAAVLECFSTRGLRTLVYAYRQVSASEAVAWLASMEEAEATPAADERAWRIREAYAALERDMVYCGCTAVEDQLQERVGLTISQLRNANIRVWMLTGDKSETARQTAVASGLLTSQDRVFGLVAPTASSGNPQSTREEQLAFTRSVVTRLLANEPILRDAVQVEQTQSFWQRMYVRSGLKEYVDEFLSPFSYEYLKPLNHPLTYANPDPELYAPGAVARMTTPTPTTTAVAAAAAAPTDFSSADATAAATDNGGASAGYSLLLSGATIGLVFASGDKQLHKDFNRVLLSANTVICSRTAPDQKAKIVNVVKAAGKVSLAIGDGGNDVAMIQAAHVGVGIKGKEGNQAALSSDFAIGQFRFLSRLILVHGHMAYQRTSVIVQQSFWKSVLIAWVQVLFNMFTDFSGISFWDSFSLVLYNAIPTVPVTFLCTMDVVLSPRMLMRNPQLYRMSQRGRYLSSTTFYGYVARAIMHGTIVFFLALALNRGSGGLLSRTGRTIDRSGDFYAAYFSVVTVHTYTVLTESHSINFAHWQCFLFSVWSCFLCFWLFSASPSSSNPTFHTLLFDPQFYLSYGIITAVVCYSQALFATVKVFWFPNVLQLQRTSALLARSVVASPHSLLLAALFEDDNPSAFWRSWSPLHACFPRAPSPTREAAVTETETTTSAGVAATPTSPGV